ncbi:DUF4974 domain-containing protein [Mucilaginibacter conchicola]|uniref:DUF4974 domain-containing protein n=1 Tax=Mucilaginibacter conchicola TaxID=2303333 RepID=A0A372NPQ6_9SPHI|nr:FecR domain-containing protein [Mucilaginibacter conchicola]RFZ90926.1 DUF4974 domain-containing protein [Mucilaginibacter conchicola]
MPDNKQVNRLRFLADKWLSGRMSATEKAEFDQWYNTFDDTTWVEQRDESVEELRERLYQNIISRQSVPVTDGKQIPLWAKLSAAAAILIFIAVTGWLYFGKQPVTQITYQPKPYKEILPGGNYAVLKLSNGKQIDLDAATKGPLSYDKAEAVSKTTDGAIAYQKGRVTDGGAMAYNEIATKRGGIYTVTLADGTKVMLNSSSSLRYPVAFKGNQRRVQLTGEGYFEVAKDKNKPFIVETAQQSVTVLGTHFNVNSYADEPSVKTTLLEGKVKVAGLNSSNTEILQPGQQAVLMKTKFSVKQADIDEATAWTNNDFIFRNETLESVMRKISRWYDVDITYQQDAQRALRIDAEIVKSKKLSAILSILEESGKVHFKINDRSIVVM